jgi:predicted dehydrogenase
MITAIMIGAGSRGIGAYGYYAEAHPQEIRFVAVADPDPMRRGYFAMRHGISPDHVYAGYEEILREPKLADACFVCTQDNLHFIPAQRAMEKGYHLFLEKPMAVDPVECIQLGKIAEDHRVRLMIGHVLRYTPFFSAIKRLLDEGRIGTLMSIQHNENVSYWHQAHSYVRGNWRNSRLSSPMILAKSCHDLDLLIWFAHSHPKKVSSFGKLSYFTPENAPQGAPAYCLDGCPAQDTCVYYAPRVYPNAPDWLKLPVSNDMSTEALLKALKKGPYGRCVFRCDNDVVDHQVTAIEFANGVTVAFTMTAFTHENTRTIKLMGTKGEIRGHMESNRLEIYAFGKDQPEIVDLATVDAGHGGGDFGIMKAFTELLETGSHSEVASDKSSIESHLLAFAAEESRLKGETVDFSDFVARLGR